uniref:Uncharacterized protein n=1 Tax=Romanomermis culicivorax TaxID=13658 RepID=A0A915KK43_ROMCU
MTDDDTLAKSGLFFDDLHKLRIVKPESNQISRDLAQNGRQFVEHNEKLATTIESLLESIAVLSKEVEEAKVKALGSRSLLKNIDKQKHAECQQLLALIKEKQCELDRLKIENDSLLKEERDQKEFIAQFAND